MAGYQTYQDLVDSVADYLKEDGLQSQIGDFILLFETIEAYKLRHPLGQTIDDYDVTAAQQDLPADCANVRAFGIKGREPMTQVPYENIYDGRQNTYAVLGTTAGQRIILPTNAVSEPFTAEIVYITNIGRLVDSVNWLYQNFPMLYLYGTLLQAMPYLDQDPRVATWNTFYQGAMDAFETSGGNIEAGDVQRSSARTRRRI